MKHGVEAISEIREGMDDYRAEKVEEEILDKIEAGRTEVAQKARVETAREKDDRFANPHITFRAMSDY